jgi:hypothetical protein
MPYLRFKTWDDSLNFFIENNLVNNNTSCKLY